MSKLFPAINSIAIVVHLPVVSACHAIWHVEPSLKESPGAGASGVGSAKTGAIMQRARSVAENIACCNPWDVKI